MARRIGFGLLWIGFAAYAFLLAPPNQPDTFDLIRDLSTGNWDGINPLVVCLFNIMGVMPMLYACLLFLDGHGQKVPAWPFATLSFGVGAFMILPYLVLRGSNPTFKGEKNWLLKLLDSRWTAIALSLGALGLFFYGITAGDWANFAQQWRSDRFIHVMSLDFCLLSVLFPALVGDDMARRNWQDSRIFWLSFLPFFGGILYLCLRPPIGDRSAVSTEPIANRG
ncbi:DUF2834 domain-containing protein [Microcoleus sp. FACHB-1515]|uniref:DUF2834 domain-containing protein n=1 Tax=Cyanophyceae TaxID=3028117 RepID=UPI001682102B|nr:DUF2834 domain-containing protein [Microcoleus sp. FACHB-1515]MBD2088499.1 DUF2834 domain-containing protein [Microcoleus sp. FACHB-1515]